MTAQKTILQKFGDWIDTRKNMIEAYQSMPKEYFFGFLVGATASIFVLSTPENLLNSLKSMLGVIILVFIGNLLYYQLTKKEVKK